MVLLLVLNQPIIRGFPGSTVVKNLPASAGNTRDMGSILVARRSPAVGNGNPLQSSCLGNSTDREAWDATIMGLQKVGHD